MKHVFRRRVPALVVAALLLTGVLAVSSDAGHQTSVASYTGCLKTSGGTLSRFAAGNSPLSACPSGHVEVHVSGGDITAVNAGTGLTGTATEGAASLSVDTSVIQARVSGTCAVGSAIRQINGDGTVVCESIPSGGSGGGELILIQRHEFDTSENYFFDSGLPDWEVVVTGGADLFFDPQQPAYITSAMTMDTQQSPFTSGSVVVRGKRQASVSNGTLVFKTRVLDAYAETSGAVYGDAQPRGLANGSDRNNAIEFINAGGAGATLVGCRTVAGGTVTQTIADIGQWVRHPAVYQIVATPTEAKFYVNGILECTHTTNIPTTPLNMYFSTSDGGAGNVPVTVDWVSFEQRQP